MAGIPAGRLTAFEDAPAVEVPEQDACPEVGDEEGVVGGGLGGRPQVVETFSRTELLRGRLVAPTEETEVCLLVMTIPTKS